MNTEPFKTTENLKYFLRMWQSNQIESGIVPFEPIDYSFDEIQFEFSSRIVQVIHYIFTNLNCVAGPSRPPCHWTQILLISFREGS